MSIKKNFLLVFYLLFIVFFSISTITNENQLFNNYVVQSKFIFPAFILYTSSTLELETYKMIRLKTPKTLFFYEFQLVLKNLIIFMIIYMSVDNITFLIMKHQVPLLFNKKILVFYLLYIVQLALVLLLLNALYSLLKIFTKNKIISILIMCGFSISIYILNYYFTIEFTTLKMIYDFQFFKTIFSWKIYIIQNLTIILKIIVISWICYEKIAIEDYL